MQPAEEVHPGQGQGMRQVERFGIRVGEEAKNLSGQGDHRLKEWRLEDRKVKIGGAQLARCDQWV